MNQPTDLIPVTKARKLLGVGPVKMSQMLKDGTLRYWTNPLDARIKFVSRTEVEALKSSYEEAA